VWVFSAGCQGNLLHCGLSMGRSSFRKYPPALAQGSSMASSVGVCSTMVYSMGCWRISTWAHETPPPPPFPALVFLGFLGIFSFVPHLQAAVCPFLHMLSRFPRSTTILAVVLSCAIGASWNWLCPARGRHGLSSPAATLQASTSPRKLSTTLQKI